MKSDVNILRCARVNPQYIQALFGNACLLNISATLTLPIRCIVIYIQSWKLEQLCGLRQNCTRGENIWSFDFLLKTFCFHYMLLGKHSALKIQNLSVLWQVEKKNIRGFEHRSSIFNLSARNTVFHPCKIVAKYILVNFPTRLYHLSSMPMI